MSKQTSTSPINNYIAGIFSGFAQTIVGHPLDTCKVLLQSNKKILINRNIYKGIQYPLLFSGFHQCIIFGINKQIYNNFYKNYYISGFLTGIFGTVFLTPIDLYKIRLQNNITTTKHIFPFLGFKSTLLRESIAYSIYFGSYYNLQQKINNSFISGGIAGILCWLFSYNIDVIKTRIQSNQCNTILEGYKIGNLWKGITPCLARSFVVNSIGFTTYEYILKYCENYSSNHS